MIDLQFEIKADALIEKLKEAKKKLDNLQKPLREAGLYMERETRLNFARQSSPEGAPWAALKASTLRRKRSGAILRETSALMGSVQFMGASNTEAKVGAGTAYGVYHQFGTSKMAARPFIGIAARHEPQIEQIFQQYLQELL